jgi:hypothetical protein
MLAALLSKRLNQSTFIAIVVFSESCAAALYKIHVLAKRSTANSAIVFFACEALRQRHHNGCQTYIIIGHGSVMAALRAVDCCNVRSAHSLAQREHATNINCTIPGSARFSAAVPRAHSRKHIHTNLAIMMQCVHSNAALTRYPCAASEQIQHTLSSPSCSERNVMHHYCSHLHQGDTPNTKKLESITTLSAAVHTSECMQSTALRSRDSTTTAVSAALTLPARSHSYRHP